MMKNRLIVLSMLAATVAVGSASFAAGVPLTTAEATAPIPGATLAPTPPIPPAPPSAADAPANAPSAPAPAPPRFSQEQLDQLVAPVALYPDQLLSQILMASTYPLEVVEAARWAREPANRALKGDALAEALKAKGWDPSVMALVPFREVLAVLDSRLDWMRSLGSAFVAQQGDVMAAVQRLRHLAMAAGNLKTTPQCHCVVATEGETITIAAAQSGPVCIPVYRSRVAYGAWPYPAYPPIEFPVPVGIGFLPGAYIGFYPGIDVAWYGPLWGWGGFDWGAGRILVDPGRYGFLAAGGIGFVGGVWAHDPRRWGAIGSFNSSAGRFGPGRAGAVAVGGAAAIGGAAVIRGRGNVAGTQVFRGGSHAARGFRGAAGSHGAQAFGGPRGGGRGGPGHFAGGPRGGGPRGGGHFGGGPHGGGGHFGGPAHVAMGGGGHGGGGHGGGGGGGGGHHGH
jgi:hypothetical protein